VPRVPFIALRQLGAVGGQQGRPKLPSVGGCTGQSGAPPDSHCRWSGVDLFLFLAQMTVAAPWQLAHQTLGHASPTDCTADRCTGAVGAPDTIRCTPDSPVPPADRWRGPRVARGFHGRLLCWWPLVYQTIWCATGQSGEL
jgi:hypothetical protein